MIFIHQTAEIDKTAKINKNTKIWKNVQIGKNSRIGENCIIGKDVYVDHDVEIDNNCKIQNQTLIYYGVHIESNVFIGPSVCFTNDKIPRSTLPNGLLKTEKDWKAEKTLVKTGASIGAASVILPGVSIGKWAMVGAGSVVSKNIPDHGLVYGNPAKLQGYVCICGEKLIKKISFLLCLKCNFKLNL